MKTTPEARAGATMVVEKALAWMIYQQWHPDCLTTNFGRAYRDWRAGIAIEDIYFARGLKLPKTMNGFQLPRPP